MAEWSITYDKWVPKEQTLREALCTLGNGYIATRGAFEEAKAEPELNYPGTYLAGGYNRLTSEVAGKEIENEDLVNWPNWLPVSFRQQGEEWFHLSNVEVLDFKQELDLRHGLLCRYVHFRDSKGRETKLNTRRIVSMANPHLAALQWQLTPVNWSGEIELRAALDGRVTNSGIARYRALASQHLITLEQGQHDEESMYLVVQTVQSKTRMAQVARTRLYLGGKASGLIPQTRVEQSYVAHHFTVQLNQAQPLRLEKAVLLYTSRDWAISEPLLDACQNMSRQGTFGESLDEHKRAWQRLWNRCDLYTACNTKVQSVLRLHVFHLLQTVSGHTVDLDVGVPARGWHGEAYRGHIFWDELFIFPFLNLHLPAITRELLMYRYRRLNEARSAAKEAGYKGAMFPWQSGSNGREESQVIHLNPQSGRWLPDNTYLQRHISSAVAYNVWHYYQATEDMDFLSYHGAEMLLDIAQFWSTIATLNHETGRYEILHVVGPDEYHTEYPDSTEVGLNNNAYTNVMAVWVIQKALQLKNVIDDSRYDELLTKRHITPDDLTRWEDISKRMYVPFLEDTRIIAQFDGYDKLEEFDWEKYRAVHGEAMRLDRILESEGDNVNRYKASKQADVLMLFYLFSSDELLSVFEQLNYDFKPQSIPENIAYYEQRTSHGSTLSKIVHAWVLARSDRKRSWKNFEIALMSDLEDIQGGTTSEGIHLGAMAGTVDLMQRAYTGLEIRDDVLWLNPVLPDEMPCLDLQLRYRGHWIKVNFTANKMIITFDRGWSKEVKIGVRGQVHTFKTGDQKEFDIRR
ncbi:glycoside hydrolase family 65 protein [Pontibacter ramchanderi]|uniref:Trehalose/maltose hydrolase-like predicted phosphorylase n=1 Tax=Pontibacter ramchanderi TaxID=1179743 RepID=A0A2N3V232_9BACT|nr:glycosyl hydrolase family 65 protein [Pontibacter ramchanderi]PKV75680.1 trehalose/maltose hydrolase-like predicted phosphorylase [Pontibacter ramchanderi]